MHENHEQQFNVEAIIENCLPGFWMENIKITKAETRNMVNLKKILSEMI